MNIDYENIKKFLEDTENFEPLIESDTLIWIDWREYDEDIISYINER